MESKVKCPDCGAKDVKVDYKSRVHACTVCGHEFHSLRIFISYGHDASKDLALRIKGSLEERGHDVWFDEAEIKSGDDWRQKITQGITETHSVLSFLSKHSTRDPGVCIDEIGIAIGVKGGNIQTILVESETQVKPPPSISHIQWLDMHDWKEHQKDGNDTWYEEKFAEIVRVVESNEGRRFAGEIEELSTLLTPVKSDVRLAELIRKPFVGREWMLDKIEAWRRAGGIDSRLFWIMGDPGVGKSAVAAHLAHYGKDKVIAAHFCEWNKPDSRSAKQVVRNIAFQLATRLPDYRKILLTLPEIAQLKGKNAHDLFAYLLSEPLKVAIDGGRERYLVVIDALDEANENCCNPLVEMLAQNAHGLPSWIGILITSRPEREVQTPLRGLDGLSPLILETGREENLEDIRRYLKKELEPYLANRNSEEIIATILGISQGTFLFVEYVCAELHRNNLSLERLDEFPLGLSGIYAKYFGRQFSDLESYKNVTRHALGVIAAAREPLEIQYLARILKWDSYQREDFLSACGSMFKEAAGKIQPFHKTLLEWLTDRLSAGHYFVSIEEGHRRLASYGWSRYRADPGRVDIYNLRHLPSHLAETDRNDDLVSLLQDLVFLESKVAAGLAFELTADLLEACRSLPADCPQRMILALLNEALRRDIHFIDRHAQDYPQAVFQSVWNHGWWYDCPDAHHHYQVPETGWKRPPPWERDGEKLYKLVERWRDERNSRTEGSYWLRYLRPPSQALGSPLQTIMRGHERAVWSVSSSHDGMYFASGSEDRTVRIWDARNGEVRAVLQGHEGTVNSVCCSPDSSRTASGSDDKTVRIWAVATGEALHVLRGHDKGVESVSYSPDGKRVASGSIDQSIRIWDTTSGECIKVVSCLGVYVQSVSYSPDGARIASGHTDGTVGIWDARSGERLALLKGHSRDVNCVVYSPDGLSIASGAGDQTVRTWDANSFSPMAVIRGHDEGVWGVCYSPDASRIASCSWDKKIRIWDARNGEPISILGGHENWALSVSYTHDGSQLVSCSYDDTVRVWNVGSGESCGELTRNGQTLIAPGNRPALPVSAETDDGEFVIGRNTDGGVIARIPMQSSSIPDRPSNGVFKVFALDDVYILSLEEEGSNKSS